MYSTAYMKINGWAYTPPRVSQYMACAKDIFPLPEWEGNNYEKHGLIKMFPPQVRAGAVCHTRICGVQCTFPHWSQWV